MVILNIHRHWPLFVLVLCTLDYKQIDRESRGVPDSYIGLAYTRPYIHIDKESLGVLDTHIGVPDNHIGSCVY